MKRCHEVQVQVVGLGAGSRDRGRWETPKPEPSKGAQWWEGVLVTRWGRLTELSENAIYQHVPRVRPRSQPGLAVRFLMPKSCLFSEVLLERLETAKWVQTGQITGVTANGTCREPRTAPRRIN